MAVIYLVSLLASLGCMALLDRRFRLVLWRAPRAGAVVLAVGLAFFLAWDLVAIASQHYAAGTSEAMTGIMLAPELPLEEILFILFLCYLTLVLRGLLVLALGGRTRTEQADRTARTDRRDRTHRPARRTLATGERS
ncbi:MULTISPECIES: lycopene cyclase domain-containing protein [Micrococcaceae]|mgnify:CR=1 FL=1|uniref:lycopene cyclase domain-containing protein n=1 Tax=Micrococcaceae TaxID=1268 RepID=UPI001610A8BF|nr:MULTISPECIES: lycopene cyclase domain-containing protein [Micrococcaceae]MBB5749866.1 lycopene cyclase domain-containing protein [Micrococcus sp. TA1]HRO29251.1 lycopene cyclase domain-containing protein [Citricoccus sp.]HRO92716.1 lycopene cyclase domain-containing protein [Citricoccus sp.]